MGPAQNLERLNFRESKRQDRTLRHSISDRVDRGQNLEGLHSRVGPGQNLEGLDFRDSGPRTKP